jgi:tetratricopeptide (TPR) repeat protein
VAPAPPRERFGLGIATLLCGLACIWIAGVVLLGSIQLAQSRAAVDRGDLDDAANNASFAESIEPWSSGASLQLAQVEELRGRLFEARVWADEAISESPHDWHGWYVAARIAIRAGDQGAADRALERAAELSPLPLPEPLPDET